MNTNAPAKQPPRINWRTDHLDVEFPTEFEDWPKFSSDEIVGLCGDDYDISLETLKRHTGGRPWVWPREPVVFICDVHADTDGFLRSLVASGAVRKTGPEDADFELTELGRQCTFVIGGDCLDKGPHNLRLLHCLGDLIGLGADVEILAGNHDVRALVGLAYAGRKEPRFAHLWVRMGKKSIPLFLEVYEAMVEGNETDYEFPDDDEVRKRLFPDESWYEAFPAASADLVSPIKVEREIQRIREKVQELQHAAKEAGLSLGQIYAATQAAQKLFLDPAGGFHGFFGRMKLAHRAGSFLLIHAGVDDTVAEILRADGVGGLNERFHYLMETDLFELYHGPIGNTFRTKYRTGDLPFTEVGVRHMYESGLYAIVHGHRNITRGQRISVSNGVLNFECDASIDRNTRAIEGLEGPGGAAVVFLPQGRILATSTDYPYIKSFEARRNLEWTTFV